MLRIRIPSYPLGLVLRRAAVVYLTAWCLLPSLAYGTIWRVLTVGAMLVWMLLDLRAPRSVLLRPSRAILFTGLFVLYTFGVEVIVPDAASITRQFQMWIMFFFLAVGEGARRHGNEELKFMFWAVMLILPVALVTTLYGLEFVDAHAARTSTRSSQESIDLAAQGIGGFGLVYAAVLALPFLTQLAWYGKRNFESLTERVSLRRAQRALVIVNWVLCLYVVVRAGYAIALMLAFFSVVVVLIVRSRQTVKFGLSTALAASMALGVYVSVQPIMNVMLDLTEGTPYYIKVQDISASFKENEDVGTVEGRRERYERSAKLFFENPLAGTLTFNDVGKHSAVLDRFAQYGVLAGGVFFFLMTLMPFRALRNSKVPIGVSLGFFVAGVGFPLLNNIFSAWGLILYVFSMGSFAVMGIRFGRAERLTAAEARADHA